MLVALSDFLQIIYRINYLFQIVPGEMLQTLVAVTKSTTWLPGFTVLDIILPAQTLD